MTAALPDRGEQQRRRAAAAAGCYGRGQETVPAHANAPPCHEGPGRGVRMCASARSRRRSGLLGGLRMRGRRRRARRGPALRPTHQCARRPPTKLTPAASPPRYQITERDGLAGWLGCPRAKRAQAGQPRGGQQLLALPEPGHHRQLTQDAGKQLPGHNRGRPGGRPPAAGTSPAPSVADQPLGLWIPEHLPCPGCWRCVLTGPGDTAGYHIIAVGISYDRVTRTPEGIEGTAAAPGSRRMSNPRSAHRPPLGLGARIQ